MSRSFKEILNSLPKELHRKHQGRSIEEGFDCAGLVIWAYEQNGRPISHLEVPYSEEIERAVSESGIVERQLERAFKNVTGDALSGNMIDGDVWLFVKAGLRHMGIYADGVIYHVSDCLMRRDARRLMANVNAIFRMV